MTTTKNRIENLKERDSRVSNNDEASSENTGNNQPIELLKELVENLDLDLSSSESQGSSASGHSDSSSNPTIIYHKHIVLTSDSVMNLDNLPPLQASSSTASSPKSDSKKRKNKVEQQQPKTLSTSEPVKLYKNSPFGLKGHFLTMPESELNQVNNQSVSKIYLPQNRYNNRDHDDDEENGDAFDSDLEHTRHIKRLNITSGANLSSDQSSSDISGKRTHRFYNHNNHLRMSGNHQTRRLQHHHLRPLSSEDDDIVDHHLKHFTRSSNDLSSSGGDAGLDAKKCNAKSVNDCLLEVVAGNKSPNEFEKKIKLVGENLANGHESGASLLVRFSSMMYATFLVILGCILHVSELRQKSMNSSDHIYTTIVALIGIGWLLFLQIDLHKYKRYASKFILIETLFNDRQTNESKYSNNQHHHQHHHHLKLSPSNGSSPSTASSAASLVNQDRMSMNTEVIFKKTAHRMYEKRAALDKYKAYRHKYAHQVAQGGLIGGADVSSQVDNSHEARGISEGSFVTPKGGPKSSISSLVDGIDPSSLIPAYKFLHGKMGANFYLKCGMAAFCFGHVIHEGLRFGQQLYFFGTGNAQCRDSAALVAHLVTPLYSFYQLFMMFKYSNLVINRHRILARFGLMHIIGTSITFWIRTILEEAFEDFVHKMDYFKTNKPIQSNLLTSDNNPASTSLLDLLAGALRGDESADRSSGWSPSSPSSQMSGLLNSPHNLTMAKSLLTLMSSPISATITPQMVRHLPDSYACAQNTLLTTKSMNALPYLYPFTIEYNLLLAATFLSLYFNIGKVGGDHTNHHHGGLCGLILTSSARSYLSHHQKSPMNTPTRSSKSGYPIGYPVVGSASSSSHSYSATTSAHEQHDKDVGEYKSNFVVNADCHSANKGLFCGFFVLLVTLVTIVIFFVTINKPSHTQLGIKINLIQETTLTALILIVTLAGFKQIIKLNRNPYLKEKITTDDVLMLIPLPFFFIHSLLSFRAETATMSANNMFPFSSPTLQHQQRAQNSILTAATASTSGSLKSLLLGSNEEGNVTRLTQTGSQLSNIILGGRGANGTVHNNRFFEDLVAGTNNRNDATTQRTGNDSNSKRNSARADLLGDSSNNANKLSAASPPMDYFKVLTIVLNLVVMVEVLIQTNFIIDGMRRCSESRYLRFKKPARELITFAILLNITYWIVATFETKSVEQYKTEIEYYGPLPYMFISHTTLPVMLFYRYHSSVCLAEIWNRAYKPPKKR